MKAITVHIPDYLVVWLNRLARERKQNQTIVDALIHWKELSGDDK